MSNNGWIGVDFDGTLAEYTTWASGSHVGAPVAAMVERVKRWRAEGREVRIFTARVHHPDLPAQVFWPHHNWSPTCGDYRLTQVLESIQAIQAFCRLHIGEALPITNIKDFGMIELWDDRCVQVRPNTGEAVGESTRGLA